MKSKTKNVMKSLVVGATGNVGNGTYLIPKIEKGIQK